MKKNDAPATPSPAVYKFVWTVVGIGFAAFVGWVVDGLVTEGGLGWWLLALLLLPVLGFLAFVGAIGLSFVRQGRRNVREAEAWRQKEALAAPPAPAAAKAPRRRSRKRR